MIEKILQSRLLAYGLIALFIVLKIEHLDYPFFWDESWPYASAIHEMYAVGPSLSPSAISPELSRGHPTLFIFLVACWMKIFGTSLVAIHSFPLFIAALFSISIYEISRKLFAARVGLLAILLTVFQPIFFVQSSFVLLEVFLAFFGLLSIYFYSKNKLTLLAVCLLMLFFTKESGLALGLTLGIVSSIRLWIKDISYKVFLKHLVAFFVPLLAIAIFFQIQKNQLGWYFFPYHVELMETGFKPVARKIITGFLSLFKNGHRSFIVALVIVLALAAYLKYRKTGVSNHLKHKTKVFFATPWNRKTIFIVSIIVFDLVFILYSAFNFFTIRYFLIALVPTYILVAALVADLSNKTHRYAFLSFLTITIGFNVWVFNNSNEVFDDQFGAFDGMTVEQKMYQFLEEHYPYSTPIATNAYLLRVQLTDARTRYLRSDSIYNNVETQITEQTQIVIFSGKEHDDQIEKVRTSGDFKLVKRFEKKMAWAEVYERVK